MNKENRYVLFGAGITGMAAFQYYGTDQIVAVIDNDPKKVGSLYEGVPVISFETYLSQYRDRTIIISIYSRHYFDCVEQIRESGVTNYFTSPPVIYGLESPEEFALSNRLNECGRIVLYGSNPINTRIDAYLKKSTNGDTKVVYIDNHLCPIEKDADVIRFEDLQREDTLVLTTNEIENPIREKIRKDFPGNVVDLYQYQEERKQKYSDLEKYKDIYKGRRCFVIGNGPSLRKEDLMTLEKNHEITFAANGIFHMYDKVSWRPTHYMLCDALAYKMKYEDIQRIEDENAFIADFYYTDLKEITKANRYYLINELSDSQRFGFSKDAVRGLYSGKTVTYVMIQMACYMGVKEIYLLGVDWTGGKGTGKGRIDFFEGEKEQQENNSRFDLFSEEKRAFETAKEFGADNGIRIYNATRGGELEVFERVDFDHLF